ETKGPPFLTGGTEIFPPQSGHRSGARPVAIEPVLRHDSHCQPRITSIMPDTARGSSSPKIVMSAWHKGHFWSDGTS
ncbi:hypothetical protein KJ590_01045, partial [Patescibacteria group bacterium]|nr:hypothetical protein [Patescibacteria group bacterium]